MGKEINRIKAVLAEAGKTNSMAGKAAGCQSGHRVKKVYEYLPTRFAYLILNSRIT